ncbi:hypothetical protein ACQPZJ_16150 [Actinoplanes sp. CA-054009]
MKTLDAGVRQRNAHDGAGRRAGPPWKIDATALDDPTRDKDAIGKLVNR